MNTADSTAPRRRPAVFLDKDGTLVHDVPHNVEIARIRVRAGAYEALRRLGAEGYRMVIVTNQPGVALGCFGEPDVWRVRDYLRTEMERHGIPLAGFYYCPHGPAPSGALVCPCRKPQPGMLLAAARHLNLDLENSWMIGDILDDVEAGTRAGCRTILLDVGNETEWREGSARIPHFRARDFQEAADLILRRTGPVPVAFPNSSPEEITP